MYLLGGIQLQGQEVTIAFLRKFGHICCKINLSYILEYFLLHDYRGTNKVNGKRYKKKKNLIEWFQLKYIFSWALKLVWYIFYSIKI